MTAVTGPAGRRLDPRSSLAAFLSFLFPGLGQAYNGQRRLAWLLALPVVLIVATAALAAVAARTGLLAELLDSGFLAGVVVLDIALLGWRLIAIAQAHGWRAPLSPRHWTGWVTGLLIAVTLGMHLLPAYWAVKAIDTIGAVSREGSGVSRGGFGLPGTTPLPEPSYHPDVLGGERVNVLLVGLDEIGYRAAEREQWLTDTMMVFSLDQDSGRSALISVPRDIYGAPLPDGRVYNAKLNSLMGYAAERPEEFPDGGVAALKGAVGELLGIKIHYFAAINVIGFKQAVDAIGGIDVHVERAIIDRNYFNEYGERVGFRIQPGQHHLDGSLALAYVRSRKGEGDNDFTRADRQQQLLTAIRAKLTAGNLVMSISALLDAVKNTISTDVPESKFSALATAIQQADIGKLERVVLQPPRHMTADPDSSAGYILIPHIEAIRDTVDELLDNRPQDASPSASAGS